MTHTTENSQLEQITGPVETITYHSEETGFCVLRAKIKGHRDLVTIVGNTVKITPGECVEAHGTWITDKRHGLQFKSHTLNVIAPTTLDGIEKYLGSGLVKGVGPHFAKILIKAFGESVFDVIENTPHRLTQAEGIGEKRKSMVISAWAEQKSVRNIMVFLQSHGVGTSRAVRIYKTYGNDAIEKVRQNPYRLAHDIDGIGFKTADILAQKLGIARDSILRAEAGVNHVLHSLCEHGHCAAEYQELVSASVELLEMNEDIIKEAIAREINSKNLIQENIYHHPCIFPASLHHAEVSATNHLLRIQNEKLPWDEIDVEACFPWVEKKTQLQLSESQKQAVSLVLSNKLSIITGGPGVGKTTVVNSILKILLAKKLSVALCAPTGRAAKRLTETTGLTAKTIHRLLEFDPLTSAFKHHQENPLPVDVVVVDESSMIDIVLLNHLLKAIPDHAVLIFVGDVDQLPSVGPGAVLLDMITSQVIKTAKLTEIFRQAANSKIIINAHRINQGEMPLPNEAKNSDFYTIYADTPEEIHDQLIRLVSERLPDYYRCNPVTDIQILTPMNRGGLGTSALNISLQKTLNGLSEPKIMRFGTTFAPGDKVIQTINNYDKEVFNGDIGYITQINLKDNSLKIAFDNRTIEYDFNELDEINLAYAITIHKSQGSEFPFVVMLASTQHYSLLARNLLYTGVTRGKKIVVLVGQKKAVAMAVNNNRENTRLTRLSERLATHTMSS